MSGAPKEAADRMLRTVFKRSGVKGAHPHKFRHYAGFRTMPGELILGLIGGSLASIFPA